MSTPMTRPVGPGHLRGDEQVGAGAAAEVEHDRAGLDAARAVQWLATPAKLSTVASGTRASSGSG